MGSESQAGSRKGLADLSDGELMSRLAGGEMETLGEIYIRYGTIPRSALRRFVPNILSEDVDELTQEVFISLAKTAQAFEARRKLKPWLYQIAVAKARNFRRYTWLRYRFLRRKPGDPLSSVAGSSVSPAHMVEVREDVAQVFSALPRNQFDVLMLHAVEGFSGEEIASILGIRPKTVWTRLHRARETIRRKLEIGPGGNLRLKGEA